MKNNIKSNILLVVAVLLIIYLVFSGNNYSADRNKYKDEIELLKKHSDSLKTINKDYQVKVDILDSEIVVLNTGITLQDQKIRRLKKTIDEKIDIIDSYNNGELQQFFTDRYGHYIDSTNTAGSTISN